jgi:hypothetical protein
MPYDAHAALSPRSLSVSTTSPAYAASIPGRVLSPHLQKSLAALQGGPPDLRVSVPHPHEAAGQWGASHHMPTAQQYHTGGGSHSARAASWDMSSYLESSSATTAGGSSTTPTQQPLQYPTPRGVADLGPGGAADQQQQQQQHRMARRLSAQQVSQAMPRP